MEQININFNFFSRSSKWMPGTLTTAMVHVPFSFYEPFYSFIIEDIDRVIWPTLNVRDSINSTVNETN